MAPQLPARVVREPPIRAQSWAEFSSLDQSVTDVVRALAERRRLSPLEQCGQQGLQPISAQSGHTLGRKPTHVAIAVVHGIDQRKGGNRIGDAAQRLGGFPSHVRLSMRKEGNE